MEISILSKPFKRSTAQRGVRENLAAYGRASTSLTMKKQGSGYSLVQEMRRRTNRFGQLRHQRMNRGQDFLHLGSRRVRIAVASVPDTRGMVMSSKIKSG